MHQAQSCIDILCCSTSKRGVRGLVWTSWQGRALARYHYCDITSYIQSVSPLRIFYVCFRGMPRHTGDNQECNIMNIINRKSQFIFQHRYFKKTYTLFTLLWEYVATSKHCKISDCFILQLIYARLLYMVSFHQPLHMSVFFVNEKFG